MRTRISLMTAALLLAAGVARGQQDVVRPPEGLVDLGLRATDISGDAARFQRYRDIGDGGVVERFRFNQDGRNWTFNLGADHLGRRDQRLFADYNAKGRIKVAFEWDQIPLFVSDSTRTPYRVEAPGVFRLADSVQGGIENGQLNLSDAVRDAARFDIRSRRHLGSFAFTFTPTRDIDVKFNLKHTRRQGTMPYTASFAFSDVVELPIPLDTRTTDVNGGIEYANQRGMVRVGYDGTWFDNKIPALVWDNPLKLTDSNAANGYSTGRGGSQGRYALWPSSNMQGVSTAASYKLPANSRITGTVSIGTWNQNEPLLPVTINTSVPVIPLPRATTEANARTLAMNYTFTSRPSPYVWVNLRYRYYDFDNRTPVFEIPRYVVMDQAIHEGSVDTQPLSYTRRNLDLDTSLTPIPFTAIRVGYSRNTDDRTFRIFGRTTENVFRTSIDSVTTGKVTVRGIFERAARTGSRFDEEVLEHAEEQPAIRHFDVADRTRNRVTGLVQYTPISAAAFSFSTAIGKDDYSRSGFGLRDNENRAYTVTVDLTPREEVAASLSYTRERYTALQRSRSASPGVQFTDPTRDWSIDSADRVSTVDAALDLMKLVPKTELRFGYTFNRSKATYVYVVPPNSTLNVLQPLPPVRNELHTGTADARYFVTEKLAVGLLYWYDRYLVDDFALGPTTITRLDMPSSLLLGYLYQPYRANSASVRLIYFW